MTTTTVSAERTVTLPRPHFFNPVRRLLGRPVPTYTAHLFADAVVDAQDTPLLAIEIVDGRHVQARFTWPGTVGGYIARLSVRERGADRFLPRVREQHDFPQLELVSRVDPAATDAEKYAWAGLDPATAPDGPTLTGTTPGTVLMDGLDDTTPPTPTTSVLHDLQHVAGLLETAQFEIAMSPGGDAAGTSGNSAWKALCAVQTVQAKLAVMADAADLAAQEVADAQRREEMIRPYGDTGVKRNLKRAASMLRMVTDRLPHTAKDV